MNFTLGSKQRYPKKFSFKLNCFYPRLAQFETEKSWVNLAARMIIYWCQNQVYIIYKSEYPVPYREKLLSVRIVISYYCLWSTELVYVIFNTPSKQFGTASTFLYLYFSFWQNE